MLIIIGIIFIFKKNYGPAMAAYKNALLLDPDNQVLQENIKKLNRAASTTKEHK